MIQNELLKDLVNRKKKIFIPAGPISKGFKSVWVDVKKDDEEREPAPSTILDLNKESDLVSHKRAYSLAKYEEQKLVEACLRVQQLQEKEVSRIINEHINRNMDIDIKEVLKVYQRLLMLFGENIANKAMSAYYSSFKVWKSN